MKIMHVDASAKRERSNSRALSRYFLERLREEGVNLEIDYLDVTVDTPPHVTEAFAIATYTPEQRRGAGGGRADEGEDVEVLELSFDEALAMVSDGRICDAKTIMLLQYAQLHVFAK